MEKKILKKLVIKKEPISNLTDGNLKQQIGGRFITSWFACPTWLECCSDACGGGYGLPTDMATCINASCPC